MGAPKKEEDARISEKFRNMAPLLCVPYVAATLFACVCEL